MKRRFILSVLLCIALLASGCEIIMQPAATSNPTAQATQASETTEAPSTTQINSPTQAPVSTSAPATPTAAPASTTAAAPTPYNTMDFYSCYAHMVSYNPSNGWAEFDYFYLHQGQDAIDYLVDHEGYSVSDAEALVNNFADSEFIEENNNTGLRTIDLNTVDVRTIVNADGSVGPDLYGSIVDISYINSLYAANHSNLLDYLFYYIDCDSNDNVVEVRQVYWP